MYRGLLLGLLAVVPASTNYTLKAYDFGSGADTSTSANYQLQGSADSPGDTLASGSYALPTGVRASTTVGTPLAPTFSNPDNSYNRLKIILDSTGAASDTTYLIAISDDNFTTTKYVQLDQTIGPSVSVSNYQTYAAWGGASGFWVLGLANNTTYKIKVAALQGAATGSTFGPTASAATAAPSLTFAVSTSLTATPPFAVTFSSLPAGSVVAADATITATITTNAASGGSILIHDLNNGLTSGTVSHTVSSATADLDVSGRGYGAQTTNASQSGGGPITGTSPFNGAGNNVGGLTTAWQPLASFLNPINAGTATITLKAKTDGAAPTATDYSDAISISLAALF